MYNSRPFRISSSPDFPKERVSFVLPFDNTGINFTLHFFIGNSFDEKLKVFILLFTCLSTRAIQLELVDSMSQNDYILAFVRFSNHFAVPKAIYTDNARSFTSSPPLICNLVSSNVFSENLLNII